MRISIELVPISIIIVILCSSMLIAINLLSIVIIKTIYYDLLKAHSAINRTGSITSGVFMGILANICLVFMLLCLKNPLLSFQFHESLFYFFLF